MQDLTLRLSRYRREWTTNRASRLTSFGSTIVSRRTIPFASKHRNSSIANTVHITQVRQHIAQIHTISLASQTTLVTYPSYSYSFSALTQLLDNKKGIWRVKKLTTAILKGHSLESPWRPGLTWSNLWKTAQLKGSVKEPNISIYFFFPLITQWCSISHVLFTGGRGVSDCSVLKYY